MDKSLLSKQGVLYIATGKKYIEAAIKSAYSVRRHSPNLPIHLFANWQSSNIKLKELPFPFSSISEIENPHRRSKIDYLPQTPFEQTLYLDSDTKLNADISPMFNLLERFEIALSHAHRRENEFTNKFWKTKIPEVYPQFNSGVILYHKNKDTLALFKAWKNAFIAAGFPQDQITLRETLWLSNIRIATLAPEYNVRFLKYHFLWSSTEAKTKIFHLQKYHDGPFWLINNWLKHSISTLIIRIGLNPSKLKNWIVTHGFKR